MFFLTRCRISTCQGLGPKKHDEISETDRTECLKTFNCAVLKASRYLALKMWKHAKTSWRCENTLSTSWRCENMLTLALGMDCSVDRIHMHLEWRRQARASATQSDLATKSDHTTTHIRCQASLSGTDRTPFEKTMYRKYHYVPKAQLYGLTNNG